MIWSLFGLPSVYISICCVFELGSVDATLGSIATVGGGSLLGSAWAAAGAASDFHFA